MITGFFNCKKISGMTSNDVVIKLKKILNQRQVGHLGTLDPMASGVLPIAVGKATRVFDYVLKSKKIYIAEFLLGKDTDTLDITGETLSEEKFVTTRQELERSISGFVGKQMQTPPAYSAIKINGRRAYSLARKGQEVEIKPREVEIYNLKLLEFDNKNLFSLRIECEGGTYVRSLGRDIAKSLGTTAVMTKLERVFSSGFDISEAKSIEEISENSQKFLISLDDYLSNYQRFDLPVGFEKQLKNGVPIDYEQFGIDFDEYFTVYIHNQLFGIGHIIDNKIKIKTNLFTEN